MNKKCISFIIVKLFKCLNFSSTFILRLLNFERGYGKLLYDGRDIFVKEKDLVEIEDIEVSDEIDNIEELEDSFELDDEVDEKTRKKDEKRRKKDEKIRQKEEKKRIRKIKNAERKQRFFFICKVLLTIFIITFTGFLNSISVTLLGFTRLAVLFIVPSMFLIPGLLIPLIWVGKGNRGIFFTLWLICVLTYIIGLTLPTLLVEYQTISLAFSAFFEWIGGLFV